jgi:lysophospholipase L1-like esterase
MTVKRFLAVVFLVLLGTGAAFADSCDELAVKFNTEPAAPYRSSAIREHLVVLDREPKSAPLMLLGDSQAQRWPRAKLDALFGTGNYINFAVSGDRIQNTIWRLDQIKPSDYDPKYVFLAIGTNNQGDAEPGCAIAAGLTAIQEKVADYWPSAKIIMLKMMPRGTFSFDFQEKDRLQATKEMKVLPQTTVIDVDQEITCGLMGKQPTWDERVQSLLPSPPSLCKFVLPDFLHLTDAGYDLVGSRAKALIPLPLKK